MNALFILSLMAGGWGPLGCVAVAMPQPNSYTWQAPNKERDYWQLYNRGVFWGGWNRDTEEFRFWSGSQWSAPQKSPAQLPDEAKPATKPGRDVTSRAEPANEKKMPVPASPPTHVPAPQPAKSPCGCADPCKCDPCNCVATHIVACPNPEDTIPNYGIDTAKISPQEKYYVNGREVGRSKAFDSLAGTGGSALEDDSHRLRLTFIGADADAKLKDFTGSAPADVKSKVLCQAYKPDDAMVKGLGFASGDPVVYLQTPDGKVLHRTDSYDAGPLAEAIRKADPNYKPASDPNLNKPLSLDGLSDVPVWVWVVGGIVILGVIAAGKKESAQ